MSLEGNQIKNLQDPTENQDAVTLAYLTQLQSETVKTTGDQSIDGAKTFTNENNLQWWYKN